MAKHNHAHKYKRITLGKNYTVFRCMLPGCHHYIAEKLIIGKIAQCWRGNHTFVVTKALAIVEKPHCSDCTSKTRGFASTKKKKKIVQIDRLKELLSGDLGKIVK